MSWTVACFGGSVYSAPPDRCELYACTIQGAVVGDAPTNHRPAAAAWKHPAGERVPQDRPGPDVTRGRGQGIIALPRTPSDTAISPSPKSATISTADQPAANSRLLSCGEAIAPLPATRTSDASPKTSCANFPCVLMMGWGYVRWWEPLRRCTRHNEGGDGHRGRCAAPLTFVSSHPRHAPTPRARIS
jgi:hypothetical protein